MPAPNIVFVMSDDHAAHAISAYGSKVNSTPHLDRLARDGVRMDATYCTNSICSPSRASILTGTYSHVLLQLGELISQRRTGLGVRRIVGNVHQLLRIGSQVVQLPLRSKDPLRRPRYALHRPVDAAPGVAVELAR